MKQGFPHRDTPESVELVETQSPTLLLEVLGNHQMLLPGQGKAATFISQYKFFLLVVALKEVKIAQTMVLVLFAGLDATKQSSKLHNYFG